MALRFERYFRIQRNTVEPWSVFLLNLWRFGLYVKAPLGAVIRLGSAIGRVPYGWSKNC